MYRRDQTKIGSFARKSPENLRRVITFVILTVRKPLHSVAGQMAEVDAKGTAARSLWGWKSTAYRYYRDNAQAVYDNSLAIFDGHPNPADAANELLAYFASLPGLGLAKGGFVVQLAFGLSGCIDSHNLERFGYAARDVSASRYKNAKTPATRSLMLNVYHDLVAAAGGTAGLWDSWCQYVADNQPLRYDNADHVSRIHCEALGLS